MAPFSLSADALQFGIYLGLGLAFGAVLEMSGFGDSRKLAAQFFLREMTVLKVMFTAILVAAVLVHFAAAMQWLDFQRIWVNPTYLWPGIVGGLIMGVGFIVGGFCPGTSLVAAATLKLDGVFFVLGGLAGVLVFSESVGGFDGWYHSSYLGRFTVADWLHLPAGVTVVMLVLMALGMFVAAEAAERKFGPERSRRGRLAGRGFRPARIAAAVLLGFAGLTAAVGQPNGEERWARIAALHKESLDARRIYIDPAEVVALRRELSVSVNIFEVRSEEDFNRFHLSRSRRIDRADLNDPQLLREILGFSDDVVTFLISNDERDATDAWKQWVAYGAINLYVVAGGINRWLAEYPPHPCVATRLEAESARVDESLDWRFQAAVGERIASAHPELHLAEPAVSCGAGEITTQPPATWFDGSETDDRPHEEKVVHTRRVATKGGCG